MTRHLPLQSLYASTYLKSAESHLSQLISSDNLKEIFAVARYFPGNLTSFLGFECRLGDPEARADWAFAVSGSGEDRRVLINLLKEGYIPDGFLEQPEWQQIINFASSWCDPHSILQDKVKCFWLEFDMPKTLPETPIPSVFFGPTSLPENASSNDIKQYKWLTKTALPLLTGKPLSKTIEQNINKCIKQMPLNTSLFQIGTMLSRSTSNGIRLYITRLQPQQIIPYLQAIGWPYPTEEIKALIDDIQEKAERFVLSFDVIKEGIGPRVGIECSFVSDNFHQETRWNQLLDYLVDKKLCLPEKRDALLHYSGTSDFSGGIMKPLTSASHDLNDILTSTITRYISHVKIVYQPDRPLEAKAYPAVRLFGHSKESIHEESRMTTEGGT